MSMLGPVVFWIRGSIRPTGKHGQPVDHNDMEWIGTSVHLFIGIIARTEVGTQKGFLKLGVIGDADLARSVHEYRCFR
jgi:hypothetical protein